MRATVDSAAPSLDDRDRLRAMADAIRVLAMDAVQRANSGHPGMPMGMADAATVLFARHLKFDPAHPDWPDRDRFVLSAGHGSMLLYAILHLTGYTDLTIDEIKNFRQLDSRTAGHPEYGHAAGIETTTGPLGQGFGNAVGMALAERILNARFGDDAVSHHTYVIAGDGCLMEGISHEAASLAGHLGLGKLIVLYDDNRISIDGSTDLSMSDDTAARFEAYGWIVRTIDGHDAAQVSSTLDAARASDRPTLIACRTTIAYGAPTKAGTAGAHGAPLGEEEIAGTRDALGWSDPPFVVPDDIRAGWRAAGARGAQDYEAWQERVAALPEDKRGELIRLWSGALPDGWRRALDDFKAAALADKPKQATRQSSGAVLAALTAVVPELIGGSADLTGSNNTKVKGHKVVTADGYDGGYIHYGVREHGMAAAMNGIALHGGLIPYGGTFLIFSDYCRPSLRLSALMEQRVVYVMTHDSIGLGEDGPTHQPVEHLASLRAMPNLNVLRPADAIETAECWEIALTDERTPSVLALSRQGLPAVREQASDENLCARGAYVLRDASDATRVTLYATGSEVQIALAARDILEADGIGTRVVSVPCWEKFDAQPDDYKAAIVPDDHVRVAVEAAVGLGWERFVGRDGGFVGMRTFGASAPAVDLYAQFGITAEAVVDAVRRRLS